MNKRNFFILAAFMIALFTGCKKEIQPVPETPEETEQAFIGIVSVPIEEAFINDSIFIEPEHIRFSEDEIIIENYVYFYYTFHQIGSAPVTTIYRTWYEFSMSREYIDDELEYLESLKGNEGYFSVIKNADIVKFRPNPQVWHGKTKCWITDDQIDYLKVVIKNNLIMQ